MVVASTDTRSSLRSDDLYPSRFDREPRLVDRRDPAVYGTAEDGPLRADHLRRYERFGFLTFERFFADAESRDYAAALERLRTDPTQVGRPEVIAEPESNEVRSIFAVHELDHPLARLCRHPRIVDIARQLLGSEVYLHQSRVNYKGGFRAREFYWHSDFETWHVEDGMPRMRAVSCSISLTENTPHNGPLLIIPGSHKRFLSCVGETPENNFQTSLRKQEVGVPDDRSLTEMVEAGGIEAALGPAGTVTFFECNAMHGSNSNITPLPRSNCFVVFNSVDNVLVEPFCGLPPRPQYIANREDTSPV